MLNVFEANAAKLRELHAAGRAAFKKRRDGGRQMELWKEACRSFMASYDQLAFPGGLEKAMRSLKAHDSGTLEMAVRFLEADPWFFRSGYIKADLIRHLRQAQLSEDQRIRVQKVIVSRIQGQDVREFRSYCHLARVVGDPAFESQVAELAASPIPLISRHAQWVLTQLRQLLAKKSPKNDLSIAHPSPRQNKRRDRRAAKS